MFRAPAGMLRLILVGDPAIHKELRLSDQRRGEPPS
jgi:hypothetical protein